MSSPDNTPNDYKDMFGPANDPDLAVRVFVLTEEKDGRVKAQRVRSPNDPRLHDGKAFAVASVHTLAACEETGEDEIRGIGEEAILRPRIYSQLARDAGDFLGALADAETDCTLGVDDQGDWHVLPQ